MELPVHPDWIDRSVRRALRDRTPLQKAKSDHRHQRGWNGGQQQSERVDGLVVELQLAPDEEGLHPGAHVHLPVGVHPGAVAAVLIDDLGTVEVAVFGQEGPEEVRRVELGLMASTYLASMGKFCPKWSVMK